MNSSKKLMEPLKPDEILSPIVGSEPLSRTQMNRKVWAYIKEHGLQDPKDKHIIWADDKLQEIFGGKKQLNMFAVTQQLNKHLIAHQADN